MPLEMENQVDLHSKIKTLRFDNKQFFFHLVSTLLGLIQNESMSKEENCLTNWSEKCFSLLLTNNSNLARYYQIGVNSILFSLLCEISVQKDGPAKILSTAVYSNYQTYIQRCISKENKQDILLGLESMKNFLNFISQSIGMLSNQSSLNNECLQLLSKFTQLNFFDLLKSIFVCVDSNESLEENSKICFQYLDTISKLLIRIAKRLKTARNFCNGVSSSKVHSQPRTSRENTKHSRKNFSSDEDGQQKPVMKKLPDFDNVDQAEDSAENVSDFDNFLFDETDSDLEVKKEKTLPMKQKSNSEMPASNKKGW